MQLCRDYLHLVQAGTTQPVGHPFCGAFDVFLVLSLCTNTRNPQKFVEIVQMIVVLLLDVFIQIHVRCSSTPPPHSRWAGGAAARTAHVCCTGECAGL